MNLIITVNTAPLTEEQIVELGFGFKDAVIDGMPVVVKVGGTDFPVHPERIDVMRS